MLKRLRVNLKKAKNKKHHTPSRRKMQFEALEPRILLSADLGIEAAQQDLLPDPLGAHKAELHDSQFVENQVQAGDTPPGIGLSIPDAEIGEKQLIIVDSTLPDYDTLVEEIQAQKDGRTSCEVRLLDGDGNSFEQISAIVAEQTDLSAIHILSHGSDGQLILGSQSLNTGNLQEHSDTLAQWGSALNEDGDILLYGCNIASGDVGIEFIESIAALTGADVAASDDATGAASLGGDWILETGSGTIETTTLSLPSGLDAYGHLLADIDGTDDNDNLTSSADESDTLTGGQGDDIYTFQDNWGSDTVVENAGEGSDTLDFSSVTSDLVFTINAGGSVHVSDGTNGVSAANIENITGGSGGNSFIFENGAILNGTINGGVGGENTIDYSAWDTGVSVDLSAGTATATNSISNIQHVIGSSSGNMLTGDGFGNELVGGSAGDTFYFNDGWGADTVSDSGTQGVDALDFSAVTSDLTVTFHTDGSLSVTDGANALDPVQGIENFIGGSGNNTFVFENGATFAGTIDGGTGGINTLDFSAYKTQVLADLENGSFSVGGTIQGTNMAEFSGLTDVDALNSGDGVNTATVTAETTLADIGVNTTSITADTLLSTLNQGLGVYTVYGNDLRIILSDDTEINVDLGAATTVGNVIDAINDASEYITAAINTFGNGISLTDSAGGDVPLSVINLGSSTAATDLGLDNIYTEDTIQGRSLVNDLRLTLSDGTPLVVSLSEADTIQDVLDQIHAASDLLDASLNEAGNGLVIRDIADGSGNLTVENLNDTATATALGIEGEGTGAELAGSSLLDNIRITMRDGSVVDVNLGDAKTVQDILGAISDSHANLSATLNAGSDGITVMDASGGTGNLRVENLNNCAAAADLGIARDVSAAAIEGGALVFGVVSGEFSNITNAVGGKADDLIIGQSEDQTLTGSDGGDTFVFANGWGSDKVEDLGSDGIDTLDFFAVTSALTFTFYAAGGIRVSDGTNELELDDVVERIIAGSGSNTFVFEDGAEFGGTIDGGSGTTTLDYAAYSTAVAVDLTAGTATGTAGVGNIDNIIGGAENDTLAGDTQVNVITGNAGNDTLTGGGGDDTLIGGLGDDTYVVDPSTGTLVVSEAAGEGTDTLDYSAYSGAVDANLVTGSATGTTGAVNIEEVVGGGGDDTLTGTDDDDTFSFSGDWGNDVVVDPSALDSDTLDFSAVTEDLTFTFNAGTDQSVSVADDDEENTVGDVVSVDTLVGGSGNDSFVFQDGWGDYTVQDAGDLDYDTLDFSAVTAELTFTFHTGGTVSVADSDGNTLGASAGIDNIIGGLGVNRFVLENGAVFDGYIEGGAEGSTNILDYSQYTTAIEVDLTDMDRLNVEGDPIHGTATSVMGINRIQTIIGGSSSLDSLIAGRQDNDWAIAGTNSGTLNAGIGFSGFETLVGQDHYDDTFTILAGGGVDGMLIGSRSVDAQGLDHIHLESGAAHAQVSYFASGADTGTILRDSERLNYSGIQWVADDTTATNRTFDYVADHTLSVTFSGVLAEEQQWGLLVDDVEYIHTVTENQSLTDVLVGLATQLAATGDYLTSVQDNTLVISALSGSSLRVATKDIDSNSTLPSNIAVAVEESGAGDTGIRLGRDDASGKLAIHSFNGTFGYFNFTDPGGLTVSGGSGNDAFSIGQFSTDAEIFIDGEGGTDTIAYDVQAGSSATVDETTATTASMVFSGEPRAGETWTVSLTTTVGSEDVTTEFSHTISEGQTLADVVSALAAAINTSSDYTAGAEDGELAVASIGGGNLSVMADLQAATAVNVYNTSAATTTEVALSGTVVEGEAWTLTVDDTDYAHIAAAGEGLADVAGALAALVNAAPGYTAIAVDGVITIVNLSGVALDVSADIPSGSTAAITPFTAQTAVVELDGDPVDGETWTLTVDGGDYSHSVLAGDDWTSVVENLRSLMIQDGYAVVIKKHYLIITSSAESLEVEAGLAASAGFAEGTSAPETTLVSFDGVIEDGGVWSVTLNGTTYSHTVSGHESLYQVLSDLTNQIDGLSGYTAACKGGTLVITAVDGSSPLAVSAAVPASAAQDIRFAGDSLTRNGDTVFTFANVESAGNLIVSATSGADEIVLGATGDRYAISSNGSFGTITFDALGDDGSLTIQAGGGDDAVTLNTSFSTALSISGGEGTDALDLGAAANTFQTLAYGSDFESVSGEGTVQDFVFNAYGADGNIAFGYLSLTALGLAPIPVLGTVAQIGAIGGAVATDIIRRTPNTLTVTRLGDGRIQIVDDNWINSGTTIINPVGSLTINTGMSYIWAGDTVTIDDLGTVNFDLTVNAGKMSGILLSPGEVMFTGATSFNGRDLTVTAPTINVGNGASVDTSAVAGDAGDITFNGKSITVGANARLLAEGDTNGDIVLSSFYNSALLIPMFDIEIGSADVTIASGSEIRGRDVTITASTDNSDLISSPGSLFTVSGLGNKALKFLEGMASLELDLSVVVSKATINIQEDAVISSQNFFANASTIAKGKAKPFKSWLLAGAATVLVSDASVTVAGTINTTEDAIIKATTDHTASTTASPKPEKGVALGVAVSVIVSDATAHVTDDAVLNVGGDLGVIAHNVSRVMTKAASKAGKDGAVGLALAVTVEVSSANALLDGVAHVGDDVFVSATMEQKSVPIKRLFLLPSSSSGTKASSGTGSNFKGDSFGAVEDAVKSHAEDIFKPITSPFENAAKSIWTSIKNVFKKNSEGSDSSPNPSEGDQATTTADIGGSLAVAVDIESTLARIGDSGEDGDDLNGAVDAGGDVSVISLISSSPKVGASASTNKNSEKPKENSVFSGSMALAVGVHLNTAEAYIGLGAVVDSGNTLTVNAQVINDYKFSYGVNLVDAWNEEADYTTDDGVQTVKSGEIVEVLTGHAAGGQVGTWYEFKGVIDDEIDLSSEDFSDTTRWTSSNTSVINKFLNFAGTLTKYLSGNFGVSGIGNTWTSAKAKGDNLSVAGSITFLELQNTASAVIKSGARINQKDNAGTDQVVVVSALSVNETVNLIGNIGLPVIALTGDTKNPYLKKLGPHLVLDKGTSLLPKPGTAGKAAVGVSIVGVDYAGKATARIEDGVQLYGDSLQVDADNQVLGVNVAASGGGGSDFGLNGTVGANVVRNSTQAQIENGAVIEVGSQDVFDPATTAEEDNGSLVVTATDSAWLFNVLGGVSISEGVGVGASVGVNVVVRDTQAVIGDLASDTSSGSRGSITSEGDALVGAENSGVSASIAVSGGISKKKAAEDENASSSGGKGFNGTGGTQGSNGSKQADEDLSVWQSAWGKVLNEAKANGKFDVNSDIAKISEDTSKSASEAKQSKNGVGISGSVAVNWASEDARAYILNTGAITLADSALRVEAINSTGVVSLAGGVAFAQSEGEGTAVGFGGALGLNVLYGTTDAFIQGVSSLDLGALSLTADRTGWVAAISAGFAGATGKKGVAIGGSIGVNVTAYTTETALGAITGDVTVDDSVSLKAEDDTVLVAVGGSAGIGGKAGFGIAAGVNYIGNTVRSEIDGLTNFQHGGNLDVSADNATTIVAATGSAGIATSSEEGYAGAGTVSVNIVNNTIEANVLNTTETAESAGDYNILATDATGIFSFAGALAVGKTFAGGASIAGNAVTNRVRTRVENSTLQTSGAFTSNASEENVVVGVTVAGAGAEKVALAGSTAFNLFINTVETNLINSVVRAGGAVDIQATDSEVCVAVSGGVAVSTSSAAIGAALGLNLAFNTVSTLVSGSVVESATSTINMQSSAQEVMVSVTLGGAGGEKFALGGSISGAIVVDSVTAQIIEGSTLSAAGDISIAADDSTTVVMVAGGFAGSAKAAVGAALSTVYEGSTIKANIDASTVTSTGGAVNLAAGIAPPEGGTDPSALPLGTSGIDMPSSTNSQIVSVTVGGAGSGEYAGGIGISVNVVNNSLEVGISGGSTVSALTGVSVSAIDASAIDALAFGGAGAGQWAGGGAVSANAISNSTSTFITDSFVSAGLNAEGTAVTHADAAVVLDARSSSIIRALGLGVSGGGTGAVSVSALGNAVANSVQAEVSNSTVRASGDVVVAAKDIAPLVLPAWMLPSEKAAEVNDALSGSPIALDANILAVNVSVAGSGQTSVGVALMGNVVTNTVEAGVTENSTILAGVNADDGSALASDSDVHVTALTDAGIIAFSVGVAASGQTAVQASGFGNVITNGTTALIDNANVNSGGLTAVTAADQSQITSLALSVAGSGSTAVSVLLGANVIANDVEAAISGSTITSQGDLDLTAANSSYILAFTGGVAASGSAAVMTSFSANAVANQTTARIEDSTVIAHGAIDLDADDASTIDALAFGVAGSGAVAVGVAVSANVIANDIAATVVGSQVTGGATLDLNATSSAGIHALALGVAGSGAVAVQVTAMGNAVANRTRSTITGSTIAVEDTITLTAVDDDPSLLPDWLVPDNYTDDFDAALEGSPMELDANILALNISVAASGAVAVNAVLTGNVITNSVTTAISDSEVTSNGGDIILDSDTNAGIISLTVGVAGSGAVAVNATGYGNVITNSTLAAISDQAVVEATLGDVELTADDTSVIRSAGISVAGSGAVSVGALIGANVITNSVVAEISGSTVVCGSTLDLAATNTSNVLGLTVGVAGSAAGAGLLSLSGNVIANTTRAAISGNVEDDDSVTRSEINAAGAVSLSADDNSEINTLAIGVAASGGGAVGGAVAANVITNSVETEIWETDLITGSILDLASTSSAIIRTLAIGVSGAGLFAVQLTVMGNVVANQTSAAIAHSTVRAEDDITLTASDEAPSVIPFMDAVGDYVLDDDTRDDLSDALAGSPVDPNANILSLMVSVAGAGGVAVNGAFTGNVITNSVDAEIVDSTVTSTSGDIFLDTDSNAGILALTVGVAGSGAVAVNATGFGNVITNNVSSTISDGSIVTTDAADGDIALTADDISQIRAAGVSVAGTGLVAGGALIGANVISNSVIAEISGSRVDSGSTLTLAAENDANILGLSVGVAASGVAAGLLSLSGNVITNTTRARISGNEEDDGSITRSDIDTAGAVSLSATDNSEINTLAIGVAASGGGAAGGAVAANVITNSVETEIWETDLITGATLDLTSQSSAIIRGVAIGVSGSGGLSVQLTAMGNVIANNTSATISNSTVRAEDDITLTAKDEAPNAIPFMDVIGEYILDDTMRDKLDEALADSPIDLNANILSLNVSVSGSGLAAVNGAFTGNMITNTVEADIVGSMVQSTSQGVHLTALSEAGITGLTAGIGAAGAAAADLTGFGNLIDNRVEASIKEGSTVTANGPVTLTAEDDSRISSVGLSIALSGGTAISGILGYNKISNTIIAQIAGSTVTSESEINLSTVSDANIYSFVGGVAASGVVSGQLSLANNKINNTVEAGIVNEGSNASNVNTGGDLILSAEDTSNIDSIAFGLSASLGGAAGFAISKNNVDNDVTAVIGSGVQILSAGQVDLDAAARQTVSSQTAGITASLLFSLGRTDTDTTIGGITKAVVGEGATITANGLNLRADDTSTATSSVLTGSVGAITGSGANATVDMNRSTEAFIDKDAVVAAGAGAVSIRSTSASTANAGSEGLSGGGVSVTEMLSQANVRGKTRAYIDEGAEVSAGQLDVIANAETRAANAGTEVVGIGIGSSAGAKAIAEVNGDVEAYIGKQAEAGFSGNQTEITVSGNMTVQALSTATPTAEGDVGSYGGVSDGALQAQTLVDARTRAYLGSGTVVHHAADLQVLAEAVDTATSESKVISGALAGGRLTKAETELSPEIKAFVGNDVSINVSSDNPDTGNVTIDATSVRAEGNAKAQSYGGGGIDVGATYANVETLPSVTSYIGGGTTITADGNVTVKATADSQGTGTPLTDNIQDVDTTADTLTFESHGLISGGIVVYSQGSTPIGTPGGALEDGREYAVLGVLDADGNIDPDKISLGAAFDSQNVDSDRDIIVFSIHHRLENGDAVKYANGGNASISSDLNEADTYYVQVVDDFSIRLFSTQSEALSVPAGLDSTAISGDTITLSGHGFQDGDAVTYSAPDATGFNSMLVDTVLNSDGTLTETDNNRIFVGRDTNGDNMADTGHDFSPGDRVIYHADGEPIGDLVNGQEYYVITIPGDNNYIQLADSYYRAVGHDPDPDVSGDEIPITPLELIPDKSEDGARVNHRLTPSAFGVLADGATYYVTNVQGDSFQLADSNGTVLSLDTTGRYGTHGINIAGIELDTSDGTHQLRIDLSSWSGGDQLLDLGNESLRLSNPPPGDGQSYAKAQGGSGGFIEVSVPTATLTAEPDVSAYVAAQSVEAGGDVEISSLSVGNVKSYTKNAAGGFVKVGEADATSFFNNTTDAYVSEDAGIIAGNDFILQADFDLANNDVDCIAHGGGFLAFADADAYAYITNQTTARVEENADINARRVLVDAGVSQIRADAYGESIAGGFTGTSTADGYARITDSQTDVDIAGGATITGTSGVDILASHEGINIDGRDRARFYGLSIPDGDSGEQTTLSSTVNGHAGATVNAGPVLSVEAQHDIIWNSDVIFSSSAIPELVIDVAGNIVSADNISVNAGQKTGSVAGADIVVDDIINNGSSQAEFRADGTVSGSQGTFTFRNTLEEVRITNESLEDLIISEINVLNPDAQPRVDIFAPTVTLQFDIAQDASSTLVDIQNLSDADIYLNNLLENPVGETRIFNAEGDIFSLRDQAVVRTNRLAMDAPAGDIGTADQRINVELVHSAGRPTQMSANAGSDTYLNLKGRLREDIDSFTVNVDSITAGGKIDVRLDGSVREVTSGDAGGVTVFPPQLSISGSELISDYYNHYWPDRGSAPQHDLGAYADMDESESITSTYAFGELEAGGTTTDGGINIFAADPGPTATGIGIVGNTNILGTGHVDADTNGSISLTETEGDMRVGAVRSRNDNVNLAAPESIVDALDDPDSDVTGVDITLTAGAGNIGSGANQLEIDSSNPARGVLNANAGQDIFITETEGDLNVALVQSTEGGAALESRNGSILDANGDTAANVRAVGIDLMAHGGGIGTESNDLETDSSQPTTGRLLAEADGDIFITEVDGELNVLLAQSHGGNARLTVPDTVDSGDDLNLLAGGASLDGTRIFDSGRIAADGSVELLAGDDVRSGDSSTIAAGQTITIRGDHANADPGTGTRIELEGLISADSAGIHGESDNDVISLIRIDTGTETGVYTYEGDDVVNVGSLAPFNGGVVDEMSGLLTVDSGSGDDTLNVDDTGDTDDNLGVLTGSSLTGLGMAEGIRYSNVEDLNAGLGSGHDLFNVRGTTAATAVHGNDGNDIFNVSSDTDDLENGTLDDILGDLRIQAGSGADTLNISDHNSPDPDAGVEITRNAIIGLAPAAIAYQTDDWFGGGINIWAGEGSDEMTISSTHAQSFTTLWLNNGNDRIEVTDDGSGDDGMLILHGEEGSDTVVTTTPDAWNADMILFGDYGEIEYGNQLTPVYNDGRIPEKSVENMVRAFTTQPGTGGNDSLESGAGNDVVFGGSGDDTLIGGRGNDILSGDGGRTTYRNGALYQAETIDFFIGGNDSLNGGAGNDVMFGGYGSDMFYGNLSEDLMVGEYARVTLSEGQAETLVRLGQGRLDLIANRQFGLYASRYRAALLADIGASMKVLSGLSAESIADRDLSGFAQRLSHHNGYQQGGPSKGAEGYGEPEEVVDADQPEPVYETYTVEEGDSLWNIAKEKLGDPLLWRAIFEANPEISDPDIINPDQIIKVPAAGQQGKEQSDRSGQDKDQVDVGLDAVAAGVMGWGVASMRKMKYSKEEKLDLSKMTQQKRSWRWKQGKMKKTVDTGEATWEKPLVHLPGFLVKRTADKIQHR